MKASAFNTFLIGIIFVFSCGKETGPGWPGKTHYRHKTVNGHQMFYREAGSRENPTIVLLHGFPSSSHTYRELIPLLSSRFHILAPDNLGSGFSDHPDPAKIKYSFDLLAVQLSGLLEQLEITSYFLYMQDFGAPVGYRLAVKSPEKIRGLIVQNANAYLSGLSKQKQTFFLTAGDAGSPFPVTKLRNHVSRRAIIEKQYLRDVPPKRRSIMSPDTWTHDLSFLASPRDRRIQIELFQDYRVNLARYPRWQKYLRANKPPTLIVWGKHDPVFMHPGARAYLRDVPDAELHLLDAGHFALEERPVEIAKLMLKFLNKHI